MVNIRSENLGMKSTIPGTKLCRLDKKEIKVATLSQHWYHTYHLVCNLLWVIFSKVIVNGQMKRDFPSDALLSRSVTQDSSWLKNIVNKPQASNRLSDNYWKVRNIKVRLMHWSSEGDTTARKRAYATKGVRLHGKNRFFCYLLRCSARGSKWVTDVLTYFSYQQRFHAPQLIINSQILCHDPDEIVVCVWRERIGGCHFSLKRAPLGCTLSTLPGYRPIPCNPMHNLCNYHHDIMSSVHTVNNWVFRNSFLKNKCS